MVLPTFNRAHTLHRALTSVFSQTRLPDEVLVVDDASTDDTAAVIKRFPSARMIRLEQNRGAAHARNVGIRESTSDLIAFLDSDDLWLCNKLEVQLGHMLNAPEIGLLCSGITVQERNGKVAYHGAPQTLTNLGWTFSEFQTYPFSTPTWLIKREVLIDVGGFDESLPNCEDLDLLARLTQKCRIEVHPEPLTIKYNQSDSLDADRDRTAHSYAHLFTEYPDLWKRSPVAAANSYRRLANMHIRSGAMRDGRRALLQAAQAQPWRLRNWALWLLSLGGRRIYQVVRRSL